jgi:hypothetical protein
MLDVDARADAKGDRNEYLYGRDERGRRLHRRREQTPVSARTLR